MVLQYVLSQSITPLGFYSMFCSWGTRPAEVPKGDRGRSGRKVADPNTTHNRKVVHFGGGSGRQPGRGSGTVARGGPGRGRREVVEEAREDIRESTTTTNPTTRRRRRRPERQRRQRSRRPRATTFLHSTRSVSRGCFRISPRSTSDPFDFAARPTQVVTRSRPSSSSRS